MTNKWSDLKKDVRFWYIVAGFCAFGIVVLIGYLTR